MNDIRTTATPFQKCEIGKFILCRVTWGKAPRFGNDLSLTYLFASTSEKKLHVCNERYVTYIYIDRISHAQ